MAFGLKKRIIDFIFWDKFFEKSYSQEGEDLILARFFSKYNNGFYVDVGAHHPKRFSNTYLLYSKGWKGINIDAMPGSMRLFNKMRKRDINLEVPIAKEVKNLTYYQFNEPALNSFSKELSMSRNGLNSYCITKEIKIKAYRLDSVLDRHINEKQKIDFMSVDVEGYDFEVLLSNNWEKYRPKLILVEIYESSFELLQNNPIYQLLISHGFSFFAKTINTYFFVDTNNE